MKTFVPLAMLVCAGCGGLDNEPLTWGIVRGAISAATTSTTVSVLGAPEVLTVPDEQGVFTLKVNAGQRELLALISTDLAERVTASVPAGGVVDLGTLAGRPVGRLELELKAPSFQALTHGTVEVSGTPLAIRLEEPGEWVFSLPAGCYDVAGSVPGLGTIHSRGCATESRHSEVEFRFAAPDGSPGREGCIVTGCLTGYTCQPDGACR